MDSSCKVAAWHSCPAAFENVLFEGGGGQMWPRSTIPNSFQTDDVNTLVKQTAQETGPWLEAANMELASFQMKRSFPARAVALCKCF